MFRHFSPDGGSLQAQKLAYPFNPLSQPRRLTTFEIIDKASNSVRHYRHY